MVGRVAVTLAGNSGMRRVVWTAGSKAVSRAAMKVVQKAEMKAG